jgi:hypothetical protein
MAGRASFRDVVFFHGHGMTNALLVLGLWAALGAAVTVNILRTRARAAASS